MAYQHDFRLLGPLEVGSPDGPVAVGGRKERALLTILLLHRGEVVSADRLIDDLWNGEPPPGASNTLQGYVSHLRRTLDPGVILTRPPGYQLAVESDRLDLSRAEQLAVEGQGALAAEEFGHAATSLSKALALWRGSALGEFADAPWAVSACVRIEELRLAILENQMEARLALGEHAAAVPDLQEAVRRWPLRERLTAQLMLALYRSGRQADALAAYRDLRRRLAEELGIDPGPEIWRLEEAMVLQKPELDWQQSRPSDAAPPSVKPFVGRTRELAALTAALDAARHGRGTLVLVAGEPGIGKTRLAEEACRSASSQGMQVLTAHCHERGASPPYWMWTEALRPLLDDWPTAERPDQLQVLRANAQPTGPGEHPQLARFRMFEGISRAVATAGSQRPIVIVLDDLQWADSGSLLCLDHVAEDLSRARAVIIGTYRDTEVTAALNETVACAVRRGLVLRLSGLDEQEVRTYLRQTLADSESDAATLLVRTGGNPFFIEQLVAAGDTSATPANVRDVVLDRCRLLPADAERMLATAAVIGPEFQFSVLERVLERVGDDDQLLDWLETAARCGFLTELAAVPGRYRFAHDLVRESLAACWSELRATRLHRRIGEVLETQEHPRPSVSELAHHFLLGARDGSGIDKAARYCLMAAQQATASLGYEDALSHAAAAVELADSDSSLRALAAESRLALGEAQWRSGDGTRARATFLAAAEEARTIGDARLLARAALGFGGGFVRDWHASRGAFGDRVVGLLEEAIAGLGTSEPRLRARLLGQLAEELYYELDQGRRDRLSQEAVRLAREDGDSLTLAACLASRCTAMWGPDALDEWLGDVAELVVLAEQLDSRELALFARHYLFVGQLESGNTPAATATLDDFESMAEASRLALYRWEARWFRGLLSLIGGRFAEAERLAGEALELGATTGEPDALGVYGAQIAMVRLEQGRISELYDSLVAFANEFVESPVWQAALCYADIELGHMESARKIFDRLAAGRFSGIPRNFAYLAALAMLATACARLGDHARAEQLYDLLLPYADRHILTADRNSWGSAAQYLGMLASMLGQHDEADAWFAQAAAANERMGACPWLARTLFEHARALRARHPAKAVPLMSRAEELARQCGMKSLLIAVATGG